MSNSTTVPTVPIEGLSTRLRGFKRAFRMVNAMEMPASPRMNEYLGAIAPDGEKALYSGYADIPLAIGRACGPFMAGNVYDKMGDKANLAIRYPAENYNITENMTRPEAMLKLQAYLNINAVDGTNPLRGYFSIYCGPKNTRPGKFSDKY